MMRLDRKATIAGMPIKEVRDGLRRICRFDWATRETIAARWAPENPTQRMERQLGCLPPRRDPTDALLEAGLIEPARATRPSRNDDSPPVFLADHYQLSSYGLRLTCANLMPPLSRRKAETIVARLMQRVAEVNGSDNFIHCVTSVFAFGSFVTNAATISDIDLCICKAGKEPWPEYYDLWKQRAGPDCLHRPSPEREFNRFLQDRYLHVQDLDILANCCPDISLRRIWPAGDETIVTASAARERVQRARDDWRRRFEGGCE
jgi:hypothetical protein